MLRKKNSDQEKQKKILLKLNHAATNLFHHQVKKNESKVTLITSNLSSKLKSDFLILSYFYKYGLKGLKMYKTEFPTKVVVSYNKKDLTISLSTITIDIAAGNLSKFSAIMNNYMNILNNCLEYLKKKSGRRLFKASQTKALPSNNYSQYGVIRVFMDHTNCYFSLTNLKGEILRTTTGGQGLNKERRTRMTPGNLRPLLDYIINLVPYYFKYIKLKFVGPSKRLRSSLYKQVRAKAWKLRFRLHCIEEGYMKTFNGCRLRRKKRK